MKKITFGVQEPYKSFLLNEKKTIEGRVNKWKFKKLEVGDILYFDSGEEFKVLGLRYYSSFENMLKQEWIKKIVPDVDTVQEGEQVYYNFYTRQQEKKYWVVAIDLDLMN